MNWIEERWIEIDTTIINLDGVYKIKANFDESHISRYKIEFFFKNSEKEEIIFSSDEELWESLDFIKQRLNVTLELEGIK